MADSLEVCSALYKRRVLFEQQVKPQYLAHVAFHVPEKKVLVIVVNGSPNMIKSVFWVFELVKVESLEPRLTHLISVLVLVYLMKERGVPVETCNMTLMILSK